jgi:hypothetical protein
VHRTCSQIEALSDRTIVVEQLEWLQCHVGGQRQESATRRDRVTLRLRIAAVILGVLGALLCSLALAGMLLHNYYLLSPWLHHPVNPPAQLGVADEVARHHLHEVLVVR